MRGVYSVTTNSACKLAAESSPAHASKVPGSTPHVLVSGLQKLSSSMPSGNLSVRAWPGSSVMRLGCRTRACDPGSLVPGNRGRQRGADVLFGDVNPGGILCAECQ
jgi:hypothetical protein